MKKYLMLTVALSGVIWWLFCTLPQDPQTIIENSAIELSVDSLTADSNSVYRVTIGDTLLFTISRKLGHLIDSFVIDFGEDTTMTFYSDSLAPDTLNIVYPFTVTGYKVIKVTVYHIDKSVRVVDSAAVIEIVNRVPRFVAGKPDTLYAVDDGDTLQIPFAGTDTDPEKIIFRLSGVKLPDSAAAAITGDSVVSVAIPVNCAGRFELTIVASDSIDSSAVKVGIVVSDKTPPGRPVFESVSVVNFTTPTWSWKSGGGGMGSYRYVLDKNDFSEGKSSPTDTNVFTSPSSLIEGTHTLFVQERDSTGNWSATAFWPILIDLTVPSTPRVTATTPTNDRTPIWSWIGSAAASMRFRVKLDAELFTAADTAEINATTYTPQTDLAEGKHTLYVQERDDAGNWSASGSFVVNIDATGPQPPAVVAATPTANRRPVWTWVAGGGGKGDFRYALDSNVFGANAFTTSSLTYIASVDLSEGSHTLYVQELDSAGNWSLAGSSAVRIDITPPSAPVFTSSAASNKLQPEWKWVSGGGGSGTFRYKLDNDGLSDGATVNTATSFIPPTNLIEGPHTFFLQECDSTGNWSAVVANVLIVDTTAPQPPEVTGLALTNSPLPTWSWTLGAGGNGAYRLKIDSNDLNTGAIACDTTAYTSSIGLAEGARKIYVQGRDAAGNWSKSDSFMTTIDLTPPDTPDVLGSALTNSLRPTWSWRSGAQGVGMGEYRYKLDSDDFSNGVTVTSNTNFTPSSDLTEVLHTLYVQERDAAGNWSVAGRFATTIDATAAGAPHVTAVSPTNNTLPTWSWTSGGGEGTYRYKLDNQDFSSGAVETTALSFTPSTAFSEGVHIFFVQESDGVNWSSTGICVVQVDLTPPSAPSLSGTTPTNDLTPEWRWSSVNGAGSFRFKLDDNDLSTGATATEATSFVSAADLAAGTHTLYLQERDAANNWSTTVALGIVIDTTPPATPNVSGTSPTNSRRPIWLWTTGGGGGSGVFRWNIDEGEFSSGAATGQFVPVADLAEGTHTLRVQECDAAGNWSVNGEKTVVIDVTPGNPPAITADTLTNDPTPTWTWTSGGGRGYYMYRLDLSDIEGAPVFTSSTSFTLPAVSADEQHVLYIREQDDAGNWSASSSFRIKIDVTKPGKPAFVSGTSGTPSGTKTLTWVWQAAAGTGGSGVFRYKLDSGGWTEGAQSSYSAAVAEGLRIFSVAERDSAGNWSDTALYSIYVLPAPSNLTISSASVDTGWGERLTWDDNSTTESRFYIYKQAQLCLPSKSGNVICRTVYLLIDSVNANVKTYVDFNVTSCDTFTYYIAAVRDNVGKTASEIVWNKAVRPGTFCLIRIDPIPIDPILREPVLISP